MQRQQETSIQVLTMREACRLCRVSENTLRKWVKQGVIRSIKEGNRRLFLHDVLMADLRRMLEGA